MKLAALALLPLVAACAAGAAGPVQAEVLEIRKVAPAPGETADPPDPPKKVSRDEGDVVTGVGALRIGLTIDEVRALLGHEVEHVDFAEEEKRFTSAKLDTQKHPMFQTGFDEVLYFNDSARLEPPVWKVYIRAGRAVVFKFTESGFSERVRREKVGVPPSCYLGSPVSEAKATLGEAFVKVVRKESADEMLHYLDRGVSLIVSNGTVIVIDVYGSLEPSVRTKFAAALEAESSP
jgi:hypothetical protein